MRTHDEAVAKLMRRPGVREEVERIEREECALLDTLLEARIGVEVGAAASFHRCKAQWC